MCLLNSQALQCGGMKKPCIHLSISKNDLPFQAKTELLSVLPLADQMESSTCGSNRLDCHLSP